MATGLNSDNPIVVSAFQEALLRQGVAVLAILVLAALVGGAVWLRSSRPARTEASIPSPADPPEAPARRLLRISFGLIWLLDGILQAQPSMPLGMSSQVIEPTASSSPSWVQAIANFAGTIWSYHPISAPAAAVWIQIGIGLWLLFAPRGIWSRLGGLVSVGWGLVVWVFAEAFGQLFAPGPSWLFGVPGAVLFYCEAGVLLALPERAWTSPRLGRIVLRVMGAFFVAMAVVQALPSEGFWQGRALAGGSPGALVSMLQQMSQTPQPGLLSSWVASFGAFDAANPVAVNLVVVIALAAIGVTFLVARPRITRAGVIAGVVLCLADWVLVQDLGFLGGVGTDPNSMIPMALVFVAGYLAITRVPVPVAVAPAEGAVPVAAGTVRRRLVTSDPALSLRAWGRRLAARPALAARWSAAIGAVVIILIGAAPMAVATASGQADPILTEAINGAPTVLDQQAPAFSLVDQHGAAVSLASLRGKVIALTFLDPVCTTDCPVIAQEFRETDQLLGADARGVDFIGVDANPLDTSAAYLDAFDRQEHLDSIANWLYLTGSLPQLQAVWNAYGIEVDYSPGGAMIAHSEYAYVIDAAGHSRYALSTDPGPGTEATSSSFTNALAGLIKSALA
ncbi:MAG: SCO family protein [Candidatus Dormiibacterota bacterium]